MSDVEQAVKKIPIEWLKYELTNRLSEDICETMRFIKNLEAIKFSDEQCALVPQVVSANYTTDDDGRLIRLEEK